MLPLHVFQTQSVLVSLILEPSNQGSSRNRNYLEHYSPKHISFPPLNITCTCISPIHVDVMSRGESCGNTLFEKTETWKKKKKRRTILFIHTNTKCSTGLQDKRPVGILEF